MPHGLVETGVQFPDSTIQTTAEGIIPTGTLYVAAPNTQIPEGWVQGGTVLSKSAYPSIYAIYGDETASDQIPEVTTNNWGLTTNVARLDEIAADRSFQPISTNGSGTWMVLSNAGRIYRSTDDGLNWTNSVPVNTTDLRAITWGFGTTWVTGGDGGKMLYTTNGGSSWTAATNLPADVWGITYSTTHSRFVASLSNGNVFGSTNGITWTLLVDASGDDKGKIAFGNGYLVIGGSSGNVYASSNGGTSWTTFTDPAGGESINSMVYGNGRFFGVGNNGEIVYTKKNSNPTLSSNWVFSGSTPIRGAAANTTAEWTDVFWIESKKVWIIIREGGNWVWAPDFDQDELYFYTLTGSSIALDPGQWKKAIIAPNETIVMILTETETSTTCDAYGTCTTTESYFPRLYRGSLVGKMMTSPATHFDVPGEYANPGTYFENTAKVIVKV